MTNWQTKFCMDLSSVCQLDLNTKLCEKNHCKYWNYKAISPVVEHVSFFVYCFWKKCNWADVYDTVRCGFRTYFILLIFHRDNLFVAVGDICFVCPTSGNIVILALCRHFFSRSYVGSKKNCAYETRPHVNAEEYIY